MRRKLSIILSFCFFFLQADRGQTAGEGDNLDCLVMPQEIVHLSSPVEGVLEKVYVDRGAIVRKGQIIAQLDSSLENANVTLARARAHLEAAIKSGEARLTYSSLKLARSEKLYARDLISLADLQEAQTEKQLAEMALASALDNQRLASLELDRANVALSRNIIRSPINGVVVDRFLSAGEFVSGQFKNDSPIVKIAQIDPLRVEVFAPVSLRNQIQVAMPAKVAIEAPISTTREVRVSIVDRVVDSASSTFRVRFDLPNPGHRIPAGMKCKVTFQGLERQKSDGSRLPPRKLPAS